MLNNAAKFVNKNLIKEYLRNYSHTFYYLSDTNY